MDLRPQRRIILALDVRDPALAIDLAGRLYQYVGVLKIGPRLLIAGGTDMLKMGEGMGLKTFLDLKLHDIPNTVSEAIAAAAEQGVDMATVHAAGGSEMLRKAADAAGSVRLLAITLLTSMDKEKLSNEVHAMVDASRFSDIRNGDQPLTEVEMYVLAMARLAVDNGVRGLVCSPNEVSLLRQHLDSDVTLVVPGVRPAGSDSNDQQRVGTPEKAIRDGANLIVIGRPIIEADDPVRVAREIANSIQQHTGKYSY